MARRGVVFPVLHHDGDLHHRGRHRGPRARRPHVGLTVQSLDEFGPAEFPAQSTLYLSVWRPLEPDDACDPITHRYRGTPRPSRQDDRAHRDLLRARGSVSRRATPDREPGRAITTYTLEEVERKLDLAD